MELLEQVEHDVRLELLDGVADGQRARPARLTRGRRGRSRAACGRRPTPSSSRTAPSRPARPHRPAARARGASAPGHGAFSLRRAPAVWLSRLIARSNPFSPGCTGSAWSSPSAARRSRSTVCRSGPTTRKAQVLAAADHVVEHELERVLEFARPFRHEPANLALVTTKEARGRLLTAMTRLVGEEPRRSAS